MTEVSRAVDRIRAGDFDSWQEGWTWLAEHVRERADSAVTVGRTITAPRHLFQRGQLLPIGRVLPPPRPPRQAADLGSNDRVLRQGCSVLGSSVRGARPPLASKVSPLPAYLVRPGRAVEPPTNGALSQRRRRNEGGVLVLRRQELRRSGGQLRGVRRAGPGRTTSQAESALSSGLRGSGRTGGGGTRGPPMTCCRSGSPWSGSAWVATTPDGLARYVDEHAALALHGACHSIKDDLYDHYPGIRPQLRVGRRGVRRRRGGGVLPRGSTWLVASIASTCPRYICHGSADHLVRPVAATATYDGLTERVLRMWSAAETGQEHANIDNPTEAYRSYLTGLWSTSRDKCGQTRCRITPDNQRRHASWRHVTRSCRGDRSATSTIGHWPTKILNRCSLWQLERHRRVIANVGTSSSWTNANSLPRLSEVWRAADWISGSAATIALVVPTWFGTPARARRFASTSVRRRC